ncbi:hypothetical protein PTSG_13190 [Salpingoeca rosetta]|uniref:Reverse transcriptase Ty1/copia-type domain-containing protein n=1 Tax=Salpingoeca rosetta (strain ATCC 50818 / BSB-021) TaxID=946362 RepID=F2UTA7_SALR5|nr:uncharacterized protein PTSG_13190 [Salpingoeca rosetta]EGD81863.1 hypothetical protein PTSG_13190 [Salpingoeca rosetta]|eukprot:XP_004987598.1 hypothetical protein PTSG_13190 [Salpingoeca rosetta]
MSTPATRPWRAAGTGEKTSAVGGHLPDIAAGSVATSAEPATVKEALASPDSEEWRQAILDEFAAMQANDVYDVVPRADLPKGHKLLRSMVIFRRKRDDQGKVIKYKARWVAKGYSQVHGVNYTDTFAPTATIAAIRTMLAMAVARGMDIQQMDVNTAFLNAPVDHEIYVQPPAVDGIFSPNTVLRLKRGLYGLKQSPRLWNHTLDAWMREQDFVATATDACIYRRTCKGGKVMWVAVYVDDLLIFADSDSDMAAFKKAISKRFKMKDLGSPDICLGIKVQHNRKARTVTMSQEHYLRNVLESFGMADCKPVGTPLCTGYVDKPADKEEPLPDVPFRELLGSLLYAATMTRPDISAAVSILSRRMQHFGMDHWKAAKHLLRYIKGTLSYTIKYAATGDTSNGSTADGVLSAYSDASFASDVDTRRSRTGFVVFCSTGPVSWNSKLQATVATASADAEYMALAATAQELMFLRQLQEELTGAVLCEPTLVHTDNQPAQRVAEHAASRMRHILVKYHYIRECVDTKRIVLSYLATEHMIADLLTKILPRPKTAQFCTMLFDQRPLPGCQPRARPHSGRTSTQQRGYPLLLFTNGEADVNAGQGWARLKDHYASQDRLRIAELKEAQLHVPCGNLARFFERHMELQQQLQDAGVRQDNEDLFTIVWKQLPRWTAPLTLPYFASGRFPSLLELSIRLQQLEQQMRGSRTQPQAGGFMASAPARRGGRRGFSTAATTTDARGGNNGR